MECFLSKGELSACECAQNAALGEGFGGAWEPMVFVFEMALKFVQRVDAKGCMSGCIWWLVCNVGLYDGWY